jgi:uncharacterized protein DUF3381
MPAFAVTMCPGNHSVARGTYSVCCIQELGKKKIRPNQEGYDHGSIILHKTFPVSAFVSAAEPVEVLSVYNTLSFEDPQSKLLTKHPDTTEEVPPAPQFCRRAVRCLTSGGVPVRFMNGTLWLY